MRLSADHAAIIVAEVGRLFGPAARVSLFGSRLRDEARGGDIDLLVEAPAVVDNPAWQAASLEARLMRRLDGRRVDVLLLAENLPEQPVHRIARAEGRRL